MKNSFILFAGGFLLISLQLSVVSGQAPTPNPAPPIGDTFNGPCFVDKNVTCAFALSEWNSQGPAGSSPYTSDCDNCNPEAYGVGGDGQPYYVCFTYGKRVASPSGNINWVESSQNQGKSSWTWGENVYCGLARPCTTWCIESTDLTMHCSVDLNGTIFPIYLKPRRMSGFDCLQ